MKIEKTLFGRKVFFKRQRVGTSSDNPINGSTFSVKMAWVLIDEESGIVIMDTREGKTHWDNRTHIYNWLNGIDSLTAEEQMKRKSFLFTYDFRKYIGLE